MTQPKARPPFFVLFGNSVDKIPESYKRYLVNGLRETFGLIGVPIRLSMRSAARTPTRRRSAAGEGVPGLGASLEFTARAGVQFCVRGADFNDLGSFFCNSKRLSGDT